MTITARAALVTTAMLVMSGVVVNILDQFLTAQRVAFRVGGR